MRGKNQRIVRSLERFTSHDVPTRSTMSRLLQIHRSHSGSFLQDNETPNIAHGYTASPQLELCCHGRAFGVAYPTYPTTMRACTEYEKRPLYHSIATASEVDLQNKSLHNPFQLQEQAQQLAQQLVHCYPNHNRSASLHNFAGCLTPKSGLPPSP